MRNRIQASQTTANLLIDAGKGHWVIPREDMVEAKGKGVLKTYWIIPVRDSHQATSETRSSISDDRTPLQDLVITSAENARYDRLIDWIVELFKVYLIPVMARREESTVNDRPHNLIWTNVSVNGGTALDEVKTAIDLPTFDPELMARQERRQKTIELPDAVTDQLRNYVAAISAQYHHLPFHKFEHCCHVSARMLYSVSH